jgi:hypothetical protein
VGGDPAMHRWIMRRRTIHVQYRSLPVR